MRKFRYVQIKVLVAIIVILITTIVIYTSISRNKFDYLKFFNQNEKEFTSYVEKFNNQNSIVSITRDDSLIFGLFYIINDYSNNKQNSVTFEVPRKYIKNEDAFWNQSSKKIISTKGTGEVSLYDYLKLCNMKESELNLWRQFLKKYNVPYIRKDESNNIVTIGFRDVTGFIYKTNTNADIGYAKVKVIKLNNNW